MSKVALFVFTFVCFGSLAAQAALETTDGVKVVYTCNLAQNPDAGIKVRILNVSEVEGQRNLVAVITSAGNISPRVIGTYPVVQNVNGAGLTIFEGKNFRLMKSSWTQLVSLDATGDETVQLSGTGPFFSCR